MKRVNLFQIAATCIASAALYAQAQAVAVVEYRNKTLDAYFITGRADEQKIVPAGGGELERALRRELAAHVGEVGGGRVGQGNSDDRRSGPGRDPARELGRTDRAADDSPGRSLRWWLDFAATWRDSCAT